MTKLVQLVFGLLPGLFVSPTAVPREPSSSPAMDPETSVTDHWFPINAAQSFFDINSYPEAPADFSLKQVHVYFRHGARVPVGVYMTEPPASIPEHWHMCKTSRRFNAPVTSFPDGDLDTAADDTFLPVRRMVELRNGSGVENECLLGELTDIGRQSTYSYGTALRKVYIEKLGFLPDTLGNNSEVYFRSTNMARTMESLQQVIHGLYPLPKLSPGITPTLLVRNGRDENLVGNVANCQRLENLLRKFAGEAIVTFNESLKRLDGRISKYIGGKPLRLDGKPNAFGILDTIRACQAHGVKVPSEFEEKEVIDLIEKAVVAQWYGDEKSEEVRRLGVGRLFSDLSQRFAHKAQRGEDDPLKILLHSTHDAGIAPIASSLGVFDNKWPAFTSLITFELFERKQDDQRQSQSFLQFVVEAISTYKASTPREHFIRMRYLNRDMHLPACAKEGDHFPGHTEFCTYAAFQGRMRELIPDDWEAECATTEGPSDSSGQW